MTRVPAAANPCVAWVPAVRRSASIPSGRAGRRAFAWGEGVPLVLTLPVTAQIVRMRGTDDAVPRFVPRSPARSGAASVAPSTRPARRRVPGSSRPVTMPVAGAGAAWHAAADRDRRLIVR